MARTLRCAPIDAEEETLMRWAKNVFGRCVELVVRRQGRSTEAHVSLSKEPSWDELSDSEKQARLRERA
jgi:hypothetical protein